MLDLSLAINIGTRIGGFSPATLFAASEPGGWYDPSDLTTLFQDSAGTTPVTAAGQSVGLWLDKSRGLVLGPELVSNPGGPFVSTTGYSAGGSATISVSTGRLSVAQTVGFTDGVLCALPNNSFANSAIITFEVDLGSATLMQVQAGNSAFGNGSIITVNITASGTYSIVTTTRGSGAAGLTFKAGSAATFFLSRVSVRELPGNHLSQSSSGQRAIYGVEPVGGRRNLLTYTEEFDNAAWTKVGVSVSQNAATAPDGTITADKITPDTSSSTKAVRRTVSSSGANVWSFYAKADGYTKVGVWDHAVTGAYASFELTGAGSVLSSGSGASGATITNVGNGWYRCSLTATASGTIGFSFQVLPASYTTGPINSIFTGDGTSGIYLWGAQLELGSTATAYQRVVTAFDVTEAGVPSLSYIQFDGSDDGYVSPTITPGIDKAQVFAGVRKLSAATFGMPVDFGNLGTGSLAVQAPGTTADNYEYYTSGTTSSTAIAGGYTAPTTNVVGGLSDIASDSAVLRVNGSQVATSALDQGTGNYLAYPLYVGRRGGVSRAYNGRIYSLIVRFGSNLSASTITQTENWVAGKTGITI